jgi:hypothetical protein
MPFRDLAHGKYKFAIKGRQVCIGQAGRAAFGRRAAAAMTTDRERNVS